MTSVHTDLETVRFGLDGTEYELTVPRAEAACLLDELRPYREASRSPQRGTGAR